MGQSALHKNVILASHITGVYDVNRNFILPDNDYSLVKSWADSIINLKLCGIIFHNNFSEETCQKYQNEYISFVKVDYYNRFNPNIYRYLVYDSYLEKFENSIENVFVTDISDVELVQNPFIQPLYLQNTESIFCGDEPKILQNEWMWAHSEYLRSKIFNYAEYEKEFGDSTLLNCGIIGGNISVMREFIKKLASIHRVYNFDNHTLYTGDMGAFNYLAYTAFKNRVLHGAPINSIFKSYQKNRADCWFRHK
jgi:hypothetical protein